MKRIKELIVVEGKHDRDRLEKLFDCDVICTDGLSMSREVLETMAGCTVCTHCGPDTLGILFMRKKA